MSKIEQLRVAFSELDGVLAVAEQRSFRRAAAALGISPSALSHAVAGLEQRLGVRLFHRTTRSVALSEAGARFVERVRPALREIADAVDTINDFRTTPTGTLRINTSLPAARYILEPFVLPFLARYPDMTVDIVTEGRLVDIVAAGFDAGIRTADTVPRDMVAVPCSGPIRFRVVASPAYLARRKRPRSPADLHTHACIRRRMPSGVPLRWEFEKTGEQVVVDVPGHLVVDSDELSVTAALRGVGLAWVNEWPIERLIAERRLISVLDDWSPAVPGICLYYPSHRHMSAGLRAFIDLIREAAPPAGMRRAGR